MLLPSYLRLNCAGGVPVILRTQTFNDKNSSELREMKMRLTPTDFRAPRTLHGTGKELKTTLPVSPRTGAIDGSSGVGSSIAHGSRSKITRDGHRPPVATGRRVGRRKSVEMRLVPGSRSQGDHRPFTAISVILQHAAILNTYCGVEAYEHEPYGGKDG